MLFHSFCILLNLSYYIWYFITYYINVTLHSYHMNQSFEMKIMTMYIEQL